MAGSDDEIDARWPEELTPVPALVGPTTSAAEADLLIAHATCDQQRLALAMLTAERDELRALNRQLHADRRDLAARVKVLEARLARASSSSK